MEVKTTLNSLALPATSPVPAQQYLHKERHESFLMALLPFRGSVASHHSHSMDQALHVIWGLGWEGDNHTHPWQGLNGIIASFWKHLKLRLKCLR